MVRRVLAKQENHSDSGERQENKTRHFEPELVQSEAEVRKHCFYTIHRRAVGPRLADLLSTTRLPTAS